MKKLLSCLSAMILVFSTSQAGSQEDEIGFNMGVLSIYNESGTDFEDVTIGATYQINEYQIKPRFDLDYVSIDDYEGVTSLVKGSMNAVYEHETGTGWTPYVVAGAGYEYVNGAVEDVFDSHGFVQGGVGVAYKTENGMKLKMEGKALQIVGGDNQDNELMVTAGVSMPLGFFAADNNECPVKISGPDKDRDGVRDSVDQCPNTPCYFSVDAQGCPVKATLRLHFDVNKAIIKPESMYKVRNFAAYLVRNKGTTVRITGHTDSDASESYNLALSQRRANAVLRKLTELGVSSYRLTAIGVGEGQPVATNATAYGKSRNRRIEVGLTYPNNQTRR